ncbi:hypothetical protein J1605_013335 [Eschrichtius robustus]|uniref:Laminin EGF-like domain-containing protein n=1 Tax=Eschrichtius robustus TaxID=9764 RepID=A0AB34GHT6_ESCRO|nr:hypothetical protein J1605_013335 [Eschrichtius robustus]
MGMGQKRLDTGDWKITSMDVLPVTVILEMLIPMCKCSLEDGQCDCRPHVTGRSCTEPAPSYFFAPLNFYIYEAEEATPLQGLAPLILTTALPTCDVYFQQQGDDFVTDKGSIILKRNQKQSIRADEQSEVNHFFRVVVCCAISK